MFLKFIPYMLAMKVGGMPITEATVKAHMTVILRKLGAANRTQAVLLAGRLARGSSEIKPLPEGIE